MTCHTCIDAGVVEITQGDFKTLAKCFCRQGHKQIWSLPMIPLKEWKHERLNPAEFVPADKSQSAYESKVQWWREKVRTAEEYWANNKGD